MALTLSRAKFRWVVRQLTEIGWNVPIFRQDIVLNE